MGKPLFLWTSPDGITRRNVHVEELEIPCSSCGGFELSPLSAEDTAPPSAAGGDPPKIWVCGACKSLVPLEFLLRLPGYQVKVLPPLLKGSEIPLIAQAIKIAFKESHHPWKLALERELQLADSRLSEVTEFRKALQTPGEIGGGVECPECGRKPLPGLPHPTQASYFRPSVRFWMPCEGCQTDWIFCYSVEPGEEALDLTTKKANPESAWAPKLEAAYQALVKGDCSTFWKSKAAWMGSPLEDSPLLNRLQAAAWITTGEDPPPEALPQEEQVPLLRRLGDKSPWFGQQSWNITSKHSPRLLFLGSNLKVLLADLQEKASRRGAAAILEDIARWSNEFPFLVKTKPIQRLLAHGLKDLRRKLREKAVRLLPIACREGIHLVDAKSGSIAYRLPHMQPALESPPVALGFMNRMVYYEEAGVLALTGHPIVAGTAWRTALDGPVLRWIDLGRYTVVQTEAGLCEISGSSGRVRWTRSVEDLDGLTDWTVSNGALVVAGTSNLRTLDPATGEDLTVIELPKRARLLALLDGDLPAPAAVIDQGYGPGIFAPQSAQLKGVKPIAGPVEGGGTELAFATSVADNVFWLWESEFGYAERGINVGPLEKKFAAKGLLVETELARQSSLTPWKNGAYVVVPGSPVTVIASESGEILHTIDADARKGLRVFDKLLLALGEDSLTAIRPEEGTVLWSLDVPELHAVDIPGHCFTPEEHRPGHIPSPKDTPSLKDTPSPEERSDAN